MTVEISAEKMAIYRATERQKQRQIAEKLALRYQRAMQVAEQASHLLKTEFGAERVFLFGSALDVNSFHQQSDVDLAVWGLDEKLYYRAVSHLLDLDPSISIDLVEAESARPALLTAIEQEGKSI